MIQAVPYVDLGLQHRDIADELVSSVRRVLESGGFVLGEELEAFEREFAAYCGTRYAVGVANGTDAIVLTLKGLGIGKGDEVITAPNSFLASASAIALAGAVPVFADVTDDYNLDLGQVEAAIGPKTRAILAVHLTGRPANLSGLLNLAERHGLCLIEDAAQAVGAKFQGRRVGTFGAAGCFSLHPLKNLNACGDGGIIVTDDEQLRGYLLRARNHGLKTRDECEFWSYNSRLDTIQAAMLRVKLRFLDRWIEQRRENAARYSATLNGTVRLPIEERPYESSVFHTYVIRAERRDALQRHLADRGIGTRIHYPTPIHLQEAAQGLGYKPGDFPITECHCREILSLPVYSELSHERLLRVVDEIGCFYGSAG
ncbi:MAG: DegT/DnrJ/EryC1/StrS family aminotransferase [Verrucomicrobiota bacterium]